LYASVADNVRGGSDSLMISLNVMLLKSWTIESSLPTASVIVYSGLISIHAKEINSVDRPQEGLLPLINKIEVSAFYLDSDEHWTKKQGPSSS
jgi:hypothetical protein